MFLPGLSIVTGVKIMGEPAARMNASKNGH